MKKTYKIGAHKIKVKFPHKFSADEPYLGQAAWDSKEIFIAEKDSKERRYTTSSLIQTFFHEISHMLDNFTGRNLFQDEDQAIANKKESDLDAYCEALTQFLLDNKLLDAKWVRDWEVQK